MDPAYRRRFRVDKGNKPIYADLAPLRGRLKIPRGDMEFTEIVKKVIDLAHARQEAERGIVQDMDSEGGVLLFGPEAEKLASVGRLNDRALARYLGTLPAEAVFALQTLMYFGRGDDPDIFSLHQYLISITPNKSVAVLAMMEKAVFGNYLADGLRVAGERQIDIGTLLSTSAKR